MKLDVRRTEGVIVFELEGQIIGNDGVQALKTIDALIADHPESPRLLFDLAAVSMMDSYGLEMLIGAHHAVGQHGGRIGIINMRKNIHNLLRLTKLITLFDHFESEAEALESFRS